jgi:hypothetical protein
MTQQDNYLMFRVGQMHTLLKQIHTRVCVSPPEAPSKISIGKGMAGEFGRTLLRVMVPYLTPYIRALLTWIGAMIVLGYKLVLRFFGGS